MKIHDFLQLNNHSFDDCSLILLVGASGSGKSTSMEILKEHRSLATVPHVEIIGSPINWKNSNLGAKLIYLDEITNLLDVIHVYRLILSGKRLVVASHISAWCFVPLRIVCNSAVFRTDSDERKLTKYLDAKAISYTRASLVAFKKRYCATYTDLDIILERYPGRSFDKAFSLFEKFNHLELQDKSKSG